MKSITLLALLLLSGTSNAAEAGTAPSPVGAPVAAGLDCNGNGIEDSVDIAVGRSGDLDQDGVPDECQGDGRTARATILGAAGRSGGGPRSGSGRSVGEVPQPLAGPPLRSAPRPSHLGVRWVRVAAPGSGGR